MSNKLRSQTGAMPTWVKVILGLAIFCLVGTTALLAVGVTWLVDKGKEAMNPEVAGAKLRELVTIEEPLPPGWDHFMALDFGATKVAAIRNSDTGVVIQFMELPNYSKKSADELLESAVRGQTAIGQFTSEFSGKIQIAGKTGFVRRGISNSGSRKMAMEQIIVPAGKHAILIQIMQPSRTVFDEDQVKPILDRIKGFPGE